VLGVVVGVVVVLFAADLLLVIPSVVVVDAATAVVFVLVPGFRVDGCVLAVVGFGVTATGFAGLDAKVGGGARGAAMVPV